MQACAVAIGALELQSQGLAGAQHGRRELRLGPALARLRHPSRLYLTVLCYDKRL